MNWLGGARSRINNQDPRTNNNNPNDSNVNTTLNGQQQVRRLELFNLACETFPGDAGEIVAMDLKWVMEIEKIRPPPRPSVSASGGSLRSNHNHMRSRNLSSTSASSVASNSNVSFNRRAANFNNDSRSSIISSVPSLQPRACEKGKFEQMLKETHFISQANTICDDNNEGINGSPDSMDSMDEILSQMDIPSTVASGTTIIGTTTASQIINNNNSNNINTSISDIFAPTPSPLNGSSRQREVIFESNFDLGILPPSPTISQMSTSSN